jgi:uncharacterized membrane protein YqjE
MTSTDTDYQLPTLGRLARRTASTIVGALQNRAELFVVEFEEENDRVLKMVMFGVGALFFLGMGMLLLTGTIIFLVPEQYRVYAAGAFTLLYLGGGGVAAMTVKKLVKKAPFAESLKQLKKDAEILDTFK